MVIQRIVISGLFRSSLGRKFLMALTGAGLFLFIIGHLLGNLQIFLGPEAINRYAHFLKSTPEILWPARIGLLAMVGIHIWSSIVLTLENRAARETPYGQQELVAASYASRTMIWSGLIVFCFIGYHLAHYTLLIANPEFRNIPPDPLDPVRADVYRMMILGFQSKPVAGFYLLSVGLLCFHLSHGISAMFQSLGLKNDRYRPAIDCGANAIAGAIFLGYASIPISVCVGLVH
jgi:succinate dehydrogenase / fumarate reductase, cytochrome b subunit